MIEEFEEWLVRKGVDPGIALDMHEAAYKGDEWLLYKQGVEGEFDGDEMVHLYHQWQTEVGEREPIKPCKLCGELCYVMELSDEGRSWGRDEDGSRLNYGLIPEWIGTFRLWRGCNLDSDDDYDKDDNRTSWTKNMNDALRELAAL